MQPPFSSPLIPHLAVPALAAYLRSKGIPVVAVDANIDFYYHLLTENRVAEGLRFAAQRFEELNAKGDLSLEEKFEYINHHSILSSPAEMFDVWTARNGSSTKGASPQYPAFAACLQAASAPCLPDRIEIKPIMDLVRFYPHGSKFSTRDLLGHVRDRSLFGGYFDALLPGVIGERDFRLVGISVSYDDQIHAALHCARAVRALLPDAHITLGGSFVSASMANLEDPSLFQLVDSLVIGDGEEPLEVLAGELSSQRPDFDRVPGLVYLEGTRIRRNAPKAPVPLEELPPPDFLDIPLDLYPRKGSVPIMPFRSSRGCYWGRCTFCGTGIESGVLCHWEQASAEFIYQRVVEAAEATGPAFFSFSDSATDPAVLAEFSQLLARSGKDIQWSTGLRLDKSVTLDRCLSYRKGGCSTLIFGMETLNPRLLKLIDKGTTIEIVERVLNSLSWADIPVFASMMVGLPTQTEEEAQADYQELLSYRRQGLVRWFAWTPLLLMPGSRYYLHPERYGISGIRVPEGQDLDGIIAHYTTAGMSRETAWKLAAEFTFASPDRYPDTLQRGGRSVPIRQNLCDLSRELQQAFVL